MSDDNGTLPQAGIEVVRRDLDDREPTLWKLDVKSNTRMEFEFAAAIAVDNELKILRSRTPFKIEMSASKFIALFAADSNGTFSVTSMFDADGMMREGPAVSGSTIGKVYFDPQGIDGPQLCGASTSL